MDINIFTLLILLTLITTAYYAIITNVVVTGNHTTQNSQIKNMYEKWKKQFQMEFQDKEDRFRLQVFTDNMRKIHAHNSLPSRTYDLGVNQFAHLTENQFASRFLGKTSFRLIYSQPQSIQISFINLQNLTDIDWQTLGKVSAVKNQGSCNAGYAFSITSLIESSLLMQNQNILVSQQQIIDCAGAYGTNGCEGGTRDGALKYSLQKGISTEKQYPYTGIKGTCSIQKGTFLPDFSPVQSIGCDRLKQNLYKSPISVAVNAKNWQLYSNGIFNNCATTSQVNHEIFLVGVTLSYWRLKNSWGSRWGEYGYIRIKLGNTCAICERPGYGFLL